jgi:type IV secretion system protein VirD4
MSTLIIAVTAAAALAAGWHAFRWAFMPTRHLPRNRVRTMRIRLRLRLHPARGHASAFECWLRWGRIPALLRSSRTRRSMSLRERLLAGADTFALRAGRALYWMLLWISLEEHMLVMSQPRTGKTGYLARVIMYYPGAVVSTSTKRDVFDYTSGIRSRGGTRPVEVFCPQHIGDLPNSFRFDVIRGCEDEATAIRRSDAFAEAAISMGGVEDKSFWSSKASNYLRALFHAAALSKGDIRDLARWIFGNDTSDAEDALRKAGAREQWRLALVEMRSEADKTLAAIRMTMSQALDFLMDPALLDAVLPGENELDIDGFLRKSGTLYMVAEARNDRNPLAPLFAVLASEIHYQATQIGSRSPAGRIDPPVLFALDEITQTCPVPLPTWLADAGGKGMQFIPVVHGEAQLARRWAEHGKQTVMDTCCRASLTAAPCRTSPAWPAR